MILMVIIKPSIESTFVTASNQFNSQKMRKYNNYKIDDWKAKERYLVA